MLSNLSNAYNTLMAFQSAVDNTKKADFFSRSTTRRGTAPYVNLYRNGEDTILTAELPGLKKEDIKIEIKEDLIRIEAERSGKYDENASIHRLERKNYHFDRTIRLPHRVEADKIRAVYSNGIMKIVLPKAEADKPKHIEIN